MRKSTARILPALVVAVLLASVVTWFGAPAAAALDTHVSIDVVAVSPNTPAVTRTARPLIFTLAVTNYTSAAMNVVISAVRSDPIGSQSQLDSAIADPKAPSPNLISPIRPAMRVTVAKNDTRTIAFRTWTSDVPQIAQDRGGICLCINAIYPIWFSAAYKNSSYSGTATTQTYVPAFTQQPNRSTVSWVWPLLDRPHRLLHSQVFTDDVLADEVAPAGRLSRLLDVVSKVSPDVPMTIVTDPDLIDELVQMSKGYSVITPGGLRKGTGGEAATQWLAALHQVLASHRNVQIVFTPFADPAVDSLHNAGVGWTAALAPQVQKQVNDALGRVPGTDLVWPAQEAVSPSTLATLAHQGAGTVLTADRTLTGGAGEGADIPDALATVGTGFGPATLAVTSTTLQRLVGHVLDPSGNGLGTLPQLVAQLAIRVVPDPRVSHYIVLVPPRDVDVNVDVAVRTIEATANSTWSRPLTIESATGRITPVDHGRIRTGTRGPALSRRLLRTLDHVTTTLPDLASVYHDPALGAAFVAPFPEAVQRCTSTSLLGERSTALAMAKRLATVVDRTRSAVRIQKPFNGTYTLTSENSQLPITVLNTLSSEVDVTISVRTKDDVPGFTASDENKIHTIKPNSKVQVHIPTHVDHVGLIKVIVTIRTKDGTVLGAPLSLQLRSTALGTIGVIITVVAAVVLALAVVLRTVRRLRRRTAGGAEPAEPDRTPAPAAS